MLKFHKVLLYIYIIYLLSMYRAGINTTDLEIVLYDI